ncbi:hypothetical protein [Paraburkholderia sp. BCC1886]|uniref:hypothetical protein n=1 Tax=Paraburkholderia sp. BCC1886 TaxID=2562670 RepID=UPI001182D550|nr:hypothetical protein [Paraburkholderia sp. BCC1886]
MSAARPLKQVMLIPYWVHETLARHKLPLSACLDFEQLRPVSSTNDLLCFLSAQVLMGRMVGEPHGTWSLYLLDAWLNSAQGQNKTFLSQTILPLLENPTFDEELRARLFSPESRLPHHKEPFYIYDITREAVGVVVNPGFFTEEAGADGYRTALTVAILKVLYAYSACHEVSSTPLFKRYLGLLSAKQLTV